MSPALRSRSPDDPALTAITLQSRRLVAAGHSAELHGTAVHTGASRVAAGVALMAAVALTLGLVWPRVAALVDLLMLAGLAADLDGGRSLVRWMWPRKAHRNLLLNPPAPRGAQPDHHVLIVIPDEAGRGAATRRALLVPAALLSVALPLFIAIPSWERASEALLALIATTLVAAAGLALAPGRGDDPTVGLAFAERLQDALGEPPGGGPPRPLHVTLAVIGGLDPWFDGLEILLCNHRPRLMPASTVVLCWSPSEGPMRAVLDEGLLRRSPASPVLVDVAAAAHIPTTPHQVEATAARRARRLGWRAISLTGGRGEPQKAAEALRAMVDQLRQGLR